MAEANSLSAYAFTVEGEDEKRMVLFKKVCICAYVACKEKQATGLLLPRLTYLT